MRLRIEDLITKETCSKFGDTRSYFMQLADALSPEGAKSKKTKNLVRGVVIVVVRTIPNQPSWSLQKATDRLAL
jgi:hypothetical protein